MTARTPAIASAEGIDRTPRDSDIDLAGFEIAAAAGLGALTLLGSIAAFTQGWVPVSDAALIAMHVADVPGNLPLVGAWSRMGWSHPGPFQYYLLALAYRLGFSHTAALMAGTLVVTTGGAAAAWLLARLRDRVAGALVLASLVAVMAGRAPVDLRDPWNPYVGIVLTGTLVVAGWLASERRTAGAVVVLPLGSLLVQAHVGYVPVVAATVAGALVASAISDEDPFPTRGWLWGVAATVLMWIPPLYEQVTSPEGNLGLLFADLGSGGAAAGPLEGVQALSASLALPPSWLGRSFQLGADGIEPTWAVPVLLAIPLAGLVVAIRSGNRSGVRALTVSFAALLGTGVGISRVTGALHEYLFSGLGAVAAVTVALGSWILVTELVGRSRVRSLVAATLLAACALVCVVAGVRQFGVTGPYESTAEAVAAVAPMVVDDAGTDAVHIEAVPEFTTFAALPGFVLALEEAGVDVVVPEGAEREFGAHRTGDEKGRVRYLVALPGMVDALAQQGWTLVGSHDPLPAADSAAAAALDAEFLELQEDLDMAVEQGAETDELESRIRRNRDQVYEIRAERFPVAVMRAP